MKTKEELNALKNEVKDLNAKLAELSEDELKEIAGGDWASDHSETPFCFGYCRQNSRKIIPGSCIPYFNVSTNDYYRCINFYNNNDRSTTYVFRNETNPEAIIFFVASSQCNTTEDFI